MYQQGKHQKKYHYILSHNLLKSLVKLINSIELIEKL